MWVFLLIQLSILPSETADVILLDKNLWFWRRVGRGRKVYANMTKYIKDDGQSHFGKYLSLLFASIFASFFLWHQFI